MVTITVQRKNQTVFEHEISSFSLSDALSVQLVGGYTETGLQKDILYTVMIYDGETTITKLCTLVGYQFNVQTYQQTVDGVTQTITGVTNNSLVFSMME